MEVIVDTQVDAPAEVVWALLAHRFADIADWFSDVESSRATQPHELAGMVPAPEAPVPGRVTVSRIVRATEGITEYSEAERRFAFEAVGLPRLVVPAMKSTTTVTASGPAGCLLRMHAELTFAPLFQPLSFVMRRRMGAMYRRLGAELKSRVERPLGLGARQAL